MNEFRIEIEPQLAAAEFLSVLKRSTLAERRPVADESTISGMLQHADVIATARTTDGLLVGVARSLTDFHYCTYLSDLAVDVAFQKQGIGKQLIAISHRQAGQHTNLILLAAPAAEGYYGKIGMERHSSCWMTRATVSD